MVGVGQKNSMSKCLAIYSYSTESTTSSIKHYIIAPTEFIIALQHTYFISFFIIQMKPMCDTFLDLFSNLFSLVFFFFLNCGYLFCLTCKNNQRNYERAESEELARVHSFMTSAKILKFEPSHPSSPLCITIHI